MSNRKNFKKILLLIRHIILPMNICVESIQLDQVLEFQGSKFNSNNHWKDRQPPPDYHQVLEKTRTQTWIDRFHPNQYHLLKIEKIDLTWMYQAYLVGKQTRKFPGTLSEELEQFLNNYDQSYFDGTQYFVRTNRVSLKYGRHGVGPYTTLKQIIESMVTTSHGHECFEKDDDSCPVYLMKWIEDLNEEQEFRIFIYQNKITAISQQNIFCINEWIQSLVANNQMEKLVQKIVNYFEQEVREKMSTVGSYVMDLAIVNGEPYFIEANSFGKEYSSGSALFHWIIDDKILYSSGDQIYVRYCV